VIEPNGKRLLLGAAAVADFKGDKIRAVRAYFDDAACWSRCSTHRGDEHRLMGHQYSVVFEHEPDPLDCFPGGAPGRGRGVGAGVGDEQEFAVIVRRRRADRRGASAPCGAEGVSCTSCGSTRRCGTKVWDETHGRGRRQAKDRGCRLYGPHYDVLTATTTNDWATGQSVSSRTIQLHDDAWYCKDL